MNNKYFFKSARLGFRNWLMDDLEDFAALNADEVVMEHFPKPLTKSETKSFIIRLQQHYDKYGHNYFATEIIETGELIGFIGLAYQTYETEFAPSTDIGWRLKKSAWGKGYATEGAKRCVTYAFEDLKLNSLFATCTIKNTRSQKVMQKIGMTRMGVFKHPKLVDYPDYEDCVWYELKKEQNG